MTTPLVQAIARAMAPNTFEGDPARADYCRSIAQAALTAITEAGYAVVEDDALRMANGALATHGLPPLCATNTGKGGE